MQKLILTCLILLAFVLSACTSRVDGRGQLPMSTTVNKDQAAVGKPITVTVTGGFVNIAAANSPDLVLSGYVLGACIGRDKPDEDLGGLCLDEEPPLPSYIELGDGSSYQKVFGKQVIESGETFILKHTFTFTSTRPGEIIIIPMNDILEENTPRGADNYGASAHVTFE